MSARLIVNGEPVDVRAPGATPLAEVLREELSLRGAKLACGEGFCGACTVLVDGEPLASCLLPVAHAEGAEIRTIESIAPRADALSPLQAALRDAGAVQCGMCTPGIVVSLTAALERGELRDRDDVVAALTGHVCRCTGYVRIVDAALQAAVAAGGGADSAGAAGTGEAGATKAGAGEAGL